MAAARSAIRARGSVLLGLLLLLIGAMFGAPSLFPAAVALVVVPALAWAWVLLAAAGLRVHRSVPAGPLLEREPGRLRIELERGPVPVPGGEIVDPLLPHPIPIGEAAGCLEREVSFPRRGRVRLGSARAVVADPLGLGRRAVAGPEAGELVVLPRPASIRFRAGGDGARSLGIGVRGGGGSGPDSWAAEFEIDGLRPYRDGTPASRIHWPTVARTGELQERRITAGADAARLLVVDPLSPASEEALDAAVRAAASLCLEMSADGLSVLIPPAPRMVELDSAARHWPGLHARLALLDPADGAPALHRIGRAGLVVWVSADPGPRPERLLRRVPASRRILVRPGLAEEGSLFSVAGCAGRLLGGARRTGAPRAGVEAGR